MSSFEKLRCAFDENFVRCAHYRVCNANSVVSSRPLRSKRHADGTSSAHKRCLFQNSKLSLIRCINFARLNSRFSPAVFLCYSGIRSNKPDRGQGGNSMLWANTLSVGENFIYIKKVRILAKLYFCSLYDKNYGNVD